MLVSTETNDKRFGQAALLMAGNYMHRHQCACLTLALPSVVHVCPAQRSHILLNDPRAAISRKFVFGARTSFLLIQPF